MKLKAITIAVGLALGVSNFVHADLLDQLRTQTGGVFSGGTGGGGTGGGGTGGGGTGGAVTPLSEVEPNDTPQTATPLIPGQPQSGAFQASGDQDWYRFRVTQAGTAATLELPPQRRGLQLSLQSASGQVLARFQSSDKDTRKFALALPQLGDVFLVAESLGASSYVFTLSGDGIGPPLTGPGGLPEGALIEVEPNDRPETATALKPGTFHGGQVASNDPDFFRLQATAAGSVEVFLPGSGGEFSLTILDAFGRILASQKSAGFDQTFTVVVSAPGDYFVQLSSPAAAPVPYLFKLSGDTLQLPLDRRNEFLRQAQREVEPNDSLVAANPIVPGQPVAGQLRVKEDEDWFALRTVQANTVINVEMPKGPAKWKISLFDAAGNLLDQRESLTDGDLVFSATIERVGKFYLAIAGVDDTRADYVFNVTGSGLQNPSDRNPNANFHNVELEPNDAVKDANPLTSAVRLVGQLRNGSDVDLFKIDSPGNEILSVELCPGSAACAAQISQNSGPWVVYVFNAKLTQSLLDQTVPLTVCVGDEPVTSSVKHLYLSLNKGLLDSALMGVIDPAFGASRKLEIGLKEPGTYYLAVSASLKRQQDGSVVQTAKNVACGKIPDPNDPTKLIDRKITEEKIVVEPFSDDQYDLQVVQTGLTPALAGSSAQSQLLAEDRVQVPVVEINGVEYGAELRLIREGGKPFLELIRIEPLGTAVAGNDVDSLRRQALRATLTGDIVHVPLAFYNGHYYAGTLRLLEDQGRLLLEVLSATELD
ncbi:hypothetical protein JCM13664_17740 [Methylothermus subterraneus]